jgi:hypothetical protein
MAAAISDAECRALDRACADLICLLVAVSHFAAVQGVAGQNGQSQPPTHLPEHGGGRGPRRIANAQPENQACTARIPAAERLDPHSDRGDEPEGENNSEHGDESEGENNSKRGDESEGENNSERGDESEGENNSERGDQSEEDERDEGMAEELDLSSFAFHLEMGDDNTACAFLSTADHNGRGCQEMRSQQSTSMDSLFSRASTASSASSVAVASRTASHSTPFGFDHRLDPDYCFNLRSPSSPRRSAFDGQTCAGATPFAYQSTPFDYVGIHGPTPLE